MPAIASQRGSHVRPQHPDRRILLTVPLHRELKRGTLSGIFGLTPPVLRTPPEPKHRARRR